MALKRKRGGGHRRRKELDFRSPSDDAWYSVRLHKEKEGVLRVMYREFPESFDERYTSDQFGTQDQLEDLIGRFRIPAQQLQDSDCGKVAEGMVVLVCHSFPEDELRFYDAVVNSVSFSEHKKSDEGAEGEKAIGTCKFMVTWQQGPLKGESATVGAKDICLIQSLPIEDPILLGFLEKARNLLEQQGKYRNSSRSSNGAQEPRSEPSHSSQGETRASKRATTLQNNTGGAQNSTESFFFWVDNIEIGTTALTIMEFLQRELSVSSQVILYPRLRYNSSCSGSIFVKTQEDANKLFNFLFDPNTIIISSNGNPWIVNHRCCGKNKFQMPRLEMSRSDENKEEGTEMRVVRPGSEGYEKAEKLVDLHQKFHEHMQGLQESLESEEMRLHASVSSKSSSNGSSQHVTVIDLD